MEVDSPSWLNPGEQVILSERAQAKMQVEGSIARKSRRGHFFLTNQRIMGVAFRRSRIVHVPLSHLRSWESARSMKGKGSHWSLLRPLLLMTVEHDDKMITVAIGVRDAEDWVRRLDELVPAAS